MSNYGCVNFFLNLDTCIYKLFHLTHFQMLVMGETSQQENILEQFPEPYDGDSSSNNSSLDDNTSNSEDEAEQPGFYEYSGMEAMMETGIHIILFIRFV